MKKRPIAVLLLIVLFAAGCQRNASVPDSLSTEASASLVESVLEGSSASDSPASSGADLFDFTSYEDEDLFDIFPVEHPESLAAVCKTYQFLYRSDGYAVQGYISIPISAIEAQIPWKCVLLNRGGNAHVGYLTQNSTAALCASTNRIVVASQYRGSDGSEGKDEFGGNDVHDVLTLVNLCDKRFRFVDMEDFCAIGISRGGMMTYLAARSDARIKLIVSASGASDLTELYEKREILCPSQGNQKCP